MTNPTFSLAFLLSLSACSSHEEKLQDYSLWKYGDGYYAGDFLSFRQGENLSQDTIFVNHKPVARLKRVYTRPFIGDVILEIYNMEKTQTGEYFGK
jgi:hypothetical protein